MHEDAVWKKALPLSTALPGTVSSRLPAYVAVWRLRAVSGLAQWSKVLKIEKTSYEELQVVSCLGGEPRTLPELGA